VYCTVLLKLPIPAELELWESGVEGSAEPHGSISNFEFIATVQAFKRLEAGKDAAAVDEF